MASSLISNTNQVYFASVLAMGNADMVAMFEALVASGLNGFLGCLGVDEGDWYKASLPKIPADAKGKAPLQEKDPIKGNPTKEIFSLLCADIELLVQLREQFDSNSDSSSSHDLMDIHVDTHVIFTTADALQGTDTVVDQSLLISTAPIATVFTESFAQLRDSISQISIKQVRAQRSLDDLKSKLLFKIDNLAKASAKARDQQTQYIQNSIKSVRQEAQTQGDVLSVKLNEYQKGTRAHHALVTTELEEIRKEVKAMDEHLATIRSEMLDFRAQAQENHLNLSTQLGFLVDYIKGGDAKKGEGGSSRPQPSPDDQSRPSGDSGSRGSGGDGSSQRRGSGGSLKKRHSSSSGGVHHSSGGGGPIRRDAEYWICGKRQF
ncbi:hypothetical protein F511_23563 [Dorcoceras hygrometricum]|uniref:Uncharacterized protein n=1 Tax=Dorcoceras hygrometricum TaxID=472368 RepID=A0A2Z7CIN6_9LAMI|nr:hypothetical protein F511_23563 [Dorcoceras hygrometricum]